MRDILISLIVFASLPFIVRKPVTGVMMWVWISVMNPHTQGWGFATHFPFAAVIAATTMGAMCVTKAPKSFPWTPVTVALLLFTLWMNVTLPFSLFFDDSLRQWARVMKIMLMTFVAAMLLKSREHIHQLMWMLAISLGFYGTKGGVFTLRAGGGERVWGPDGTFIGDNNALALALVMIIPVMYYLLQTAASRKLRLLLLAAMLLSALAALGSYSRGALLAIAAMGGFMWCKSRAKLAVGAILILFAPLVMMFMPAQWGERMDSINDYQSDASALGRLNAWAMACRLARDRFFGGGFEIYEPSVFAAYAPDPLDVHAAHSIYFQVLGEHGFVGLALFAILGVLTWRTGTWIVRHTRAHTQLRWAADLALMAQTSLVGYMVGGAFLSLAYFDLPYYLLCALVATRKLVEQEVSQP